MKVEKGKVRAPEIGRVWFNSSPLSFRHDFGQHELELQCATGMAAFAFTFASCVDPIAGALRTAQSPAL
jgi:hypothetical protein